MAELQDLLSQTGAQLYKTPSINLEGGAKTPEGYGVYVPGFENLPSILHGIDPSLAGSLGVDPSTIPYQKDLSQKLGLSTYNADSPFYGIAGGESFNDIGKLTDRLNSYSQNLSIKKTQDANLAKSNAALGPNIYNPNSNPPSQNKVTADIIAGSGAPPTPTPGTTYTIKNGDNLTKIAAAFGTDVNTLTKLNNISDPNKIIAGATLKLPDFKTILPTGSTNYGITSTDGVRNQAQATDLQNQKDALTKYGLTDTTQLTKDASGNYVPTQQALLALLQNKTALTGATSTLSSLLSQSAPQLKDLQGNPVTEQTLLTHLQAANGVTGLQTKLDTINTQIADANLALKKGMYDEEGKLKSMASISASEKRMSDQASLTLSALTNQAKAISDQLTTANGVVKEMMDAANLDYTNAKDTYDKQYTHAVQLQQLLDNESNTNVDNARANLTIMMNTVGDSGNKPTASALQTMEKLAMQSGWPSGLLSQVLSSNIGKIDYTTTGYDANGNQVVSFFSKAGGGKLIKSVTTPGVKAQPQATQYSMLQQATKDISAKLNAVKGGNDGKVAPKDYNEQKANWQSQYGLSGQSFDSAFSGLTDSGHLQDYNINY